MNTIITEQTDLGEIPVDIYQKLANNRILFLSSFIDDKMATDITAALLLKDGEDQEKKITLFINSAGGDIRCVFMIYDMMNLIQAPIETVCIGYAMDEVAMILAAGTPGMRFATKNSVISVSPLVHNAMRFSDLTDAKSVLDHSTQDNKRMMEALAKSCGKTVKEVLLSFERRTFMNGNQAAKYGLIDKVIIPNKVSK